MSRIIVPLHLANLAQVPSGADAGFKKLYLRANWMKLHDGISESDLVLDRPLDNFNPTAGTITALDTVLTGLEKLQYQISNYTYVEHDPVFMAWFATNPLAPYLLNSTATSTYVPLTRTLTINGISHDLSTDRSWTISAGVWGSITGTLSSQIDLMTYLSTNYYPSSNPAGYLTSASLSGYVPYTGATNHLNLGSYWLLSNVVQTTSVVLDGWGAPGIERYGVDSMDIFADTSRDSTSVINFSKGKRGANTPLLFIKLLDGTLNYSSDVSSYYTNRTLVDKEYVDSLIPSLTGYVPYTGANSDLMLGDNLISTNKGFEGSYLKLNEISSFQYLKANPTQDPAYVPTFLLPPRTYTGDITLAAIDDIPTFSSFNANTLYINSSIAGLKRFNARNLISTNGTIGITSSGLNTLSNWAWDLSVLNGIPAGGAAGQILAKNSTTDYDTGWIDNYTEQIKTTVKADEAILKGQAVYVSGSNGTNILVKKGSNTTELTSSKTLGLLAQDLALNGQGFVITEGLLSGLNTSGAIAGDPVWLGATAGSIIFGYTNKPYAPAHLVYIGVVTRVHATQGEIFVKPQNGFELEELHNVAITSVADKQLLSYDSTTSLWKNKSVTTADIADSTNKRYVTDANLTTIGNQSGTNTGDETASTIRTKVGDASASNTGVLNSTDWSIFNGKQNALGYNPYRYINATSTVVSTAVETIVATATVNGNVFSSSDIMKMLFRCTKGTTTNNVTMRIKINTSNTLSGATQIATFTFVTTAAIALMQRHFTLSGGNLYGFGFTSSQITDVIGISTGGGSTPYNTANTLYVFFTVQPGSGDSITFEMANITN